MGLEFHHTITLRRFKFSNQKIIMILMHHATVFCSLLLTGALGTSNPSSRRMHPDPSKSRAQPRQSQRWFFTYERPKEMVNVGWPESMQCWLIHDADAGDGSRARWFSLQDGWKEYDDGKRKFYVGPSGVSQWDRPAAADRVRMWFENEDVTITNFGEELLHCNISLLPYNKQRRFNLLGQGRVPCGNIWGGRWEDPLYLSEMQVCPVNITFTSETDSGKIDNIPIFKNARAMFETNLKEHEELKDTGLEDNEEFIDNCVSAMMATYKKLTSKFNYNAKKFWDRSNTWISNKIKKARQ